jgi:prepilin-type N-terminal cleavage/methylation domain-containing protein
MRLKNSKKKNPRRQAQNKPLFPVSKGQNMKIQKGFTIIELLVVIAIIAMLLAIFMPAMGKVKKTALRVVCGINQKGLGNAIAVYADNYDGFFPQLPGHGPWSKELGFDYDNPSPDFAGAQANTPRTITASWYLLTREADVSPKSFVCPESGETGFPGRNPNNLDIVELRDFGTDPYKHMSYAMHNPYGKFPASKNLSSNFAVAADMSPWFRYGDILPKGEGDNPPQIFILLDKNWITSNSQNHDTMGELWSDRRYRSPGQNVLYTDGHTSYETISNVGINQDNIYTYCSKEKEPSVQDIQGGAAPTDRNPENDAKSPDDSFLAI